MKKDFENSIAAEIIRNAGGRATLARTQILGLIQTVSFPLTHSEIEFMLTQDKQPTDRVTIYRVLDWLAEAGLAHKAVDGLGVFRFSSATPDAKHTQHCHLRCTGCGGIFCLDAPPPPLPALPQGFRFGGMELNIRGECPRCAHTP
jgi:Fur family ferric uptake transcriptional regulator